MTQEEFDKFYLSSKSWNVTKIRRLLNYNKDLAEDIIQDSYIRAIDYLDKYDKNKGTIATWFNRILFNNLRDLQKEMGSTIPLSESIMLNVASPVDVRLVEQELYSIKNYNHRRVVQLFYINGYTSKEISQLMTMSRTNITTVCNRFRDMMKEKYGVLL